MYAGGGSDGILPDCRVGSAALVAPAPVTDTDQLRIQSVPDSVQTCTGFGPESVLAQTKLSTGFHPYPYRNKT